MNSESAIKLDNVFPTRQSCDNFCGSCTGEEGGGLEMYGSGCLYGHSGPRRQFGHDRHGVCWATVTENGQPPSGYS